MSTATQPTQSGGLEPGGASYSSTGEVLRIPAPGLLDRFYDLVGRAALEVGFYLVLAIGLLMVLVPPPLRWLDRQWARVEGALIAVSSLGMVGLVFVDLLDRKIDAVDLDLQTAAKQALVLMLWMGLLGGSLATRRGKHLVVDAASRAVSPRAAGVMARVAALATAVFCFTLGMYAIDLVQEAREFQDPVKGIPWLPLWYVQAVIPAVLGIMGLRFLAQVFVGPPPPEGVEELAARAATAQLRSPEELNSHMGLKEVVVAGMLPGVLFGLALAYWLRASPGILIVGTSVLLLLLGAPLFVAIGSGALFCVLALGNGDPLNIIGDMYSATDNEVLLAIPFFVFAGEVMTRGAIADRLIGVANALFGSLRGGLGVSGVAACMFFAAICGSSPVTVIAIGSILYPALVRERYQSRFATGLLTTAGSLGILIPPSIPMIIYWIVDSTPDKSYSVNDLFKAGVVPGFLIGGFLIAYTLVIHRNDPAIRSRAFSSAELGRSLRNGIPALLLPVIILGGIYSGMFTATESAAVAVVYTLAVELLLHRELKVREVPGIFINSAVLIGGLFLIIILSIGLNKFLVEQEIPQQAAAWLTAHVSSQVGFLIMVNIFLLVLGCMMDIMSAILITTPLMAPIAAQYGINPIHFAIVYIVNLEIGYLTPPIGLNLFVASSVFKVSILEVIKSVVPFILIMLTALALLTFVPGISLLLH